MLRKHEAVCVLNKFYFWYLISSVIFSHWKTHQTLFCLTRENEKAIKQPIDWTAVALDQSATENRKTDLYFLKHCSLNYSVKVCRGCALLFCSTLLHIHAAAQIHLGSSAGEPHVCFPLLVLPSSHAGADWTVCAVLVGTCERWGFICPQAGLFWSQ